MGGIIRPLFLEIKRRGPIRGPAGLDADYGVGLYACRARNKGDEDTSRTFLLRLRKR
jgi:hypothetical protein